MQNTSTKETSTKKMNVNCKCFGILFKSKGHNCLENCTIVPKIELDLDIINVICITNFISVCATSANKMNGNCK